MTPIDIIGSQSGRVLRIVAGAGIIAAGMRRGDSRWRVLAVAGVVPLAAGIADVCLLGPIVHGPLRGQPFRQHRRSRHAADTAPT